MLDWQIKPLSKKSTISGRDILPGDTIVCAVILVTTLYSGFEYFQKNWDVLMPGA